MRLLLNALFFPVIAWQFEKVFSHLVELPQQVMNSEAVAGDGAHAQP
jgi:hypothetical protein